MAKAYAIFELLVEVNMLVVKGGTWCGETCTEIYFQQLDAL